MSNRKKAPRQKVLARWSLGGKYHIANTTVSDGELYFPCSPPRRPGTLPIKKIANCFGVIWNLSPGVTRRTKICRRCLAMPENELAVKMLHDPMFNVEKKIRLTIMPGGNLLEIIEHLERHTDVVNDSVRIVKK